MPTSDAPLTILPTNELSLASLAGSPPGVPAFTVSKSSSSITATITNANGATSYQYTVDGANWFAGLTASGLTASTSYPFQIRGINEFGTGSASSIANTVTAAQTAGSFSITGTASHGETLTLTSATNAFGTRTNVKPLYVNTGAGKTDTALGRTTGDKFHASSTYQTTVKVGAIPGAVGVDHYNNSSANSFDDVSFDSAKPLISYIERYYAFDVSDVAYQNGSGQFNHKAFRIWALSDNNNLYYARVENENDFGMMMVENVWTSSADWYTNPQVPFSWLSEEILFQNSDVDVENGIFEHYRDNALLNSAGGDKRTPMTRKTGKSQPLTELNLDQVSNNTGQSSITYVGYICLDDEYHGVYLGNAATRANCTKWVRQPQTAWTPGQVQVQLVESVTPLDGGYLYVRTGKDAWVSDEGVSLSTP